MSKRQNCIFVITTMLFFSGVLISLLFTFVPENVSVESELVLENRHLTELPTSNRKAMLLDGRYQRTFEQFLADRVPFRDTVILANASTQRCVIRVSNLLFGYSAFPTFYGSDRVISMNTGAIYKMPASRNLYDLSEVEESANRIALLVSSVSETSPHIKWAFCMIDNSEVSSANPASALVSQTVCYDDMVRTFQDALRQENVNVLVFSHYDEQSYLSDFFATDHHMQIQGGIKVYESLMRVFGRRAVSIDGYTICYSGEFFGSDARVGRIDDRSDIVWDVDYRRSNLSVLVNGSPNTISFLDKGWSDSGTYQKTSRFANVYGEYFHYDFETVTIENKELDESAGSILILSDSYDNSTSRLYAESYKRVYEVLAIKGPDIKAFIDSHPDIVDVVFILSPGNASMMLKN